MDTVFVVNKSGIEKSETLRGFTVLQYDAKKWEKVKIHVLSSGYKVMNQKEIDNFMKLKGFIKEQPKQKKETQIDDETKK